MQYVLFLKFAYTKSLECNWWLNHPPKVHVKTTQLILDFLWKIPCNVKAELSVWKLTGLKHGISSKIFSKAHILRYFSCVLYTLYSIGSPTINFSNNNNDRKGKSSSKSLYEETEVFLKTSPNIITLSIFFSLYSWSFSTKLKLFSL